MNHPSQRLKQSDITTERQARLERIAELKQPFQDTMQVCLNGHKITGRYERRSQGRRDHCEQCGSATITNCPICQEPIKGYMWYPRVISSDDSQVPLFCDNCGSPYPWNKNEEKEFLEADFGAANISKLNMEDGLKAIIQDRLDDAGKCLSTGAALPVVFSCGSAVEGMLSAYAKANATLYTESAAAPLKDGKVKPLLSWTLSELINVAAEVTHINEDAKKFAHALRDFRNFIHPQEQLKIGLNPDIETAKVCYQVTKLIISNLERIDN